MIFKYMYVYKTNLEVIFNIIKSNIYIYIYICDFLKIYNIIKIYILDYILHIKSNLYIYMIFKYLCYKHIYLKQILSYIQYYIIKFII